MLQNIIEQYSDDEILIANGYDDAVIGIDEKSLRLIYSVKKTIDILIADGMTYEEALEYFEYNIAGAHMGKKTPIWCQDNF